MITARVSQLARHYHKSPDLITDEELRQYFLYLKNVKKYSRAASTIALCGIKFFFEKTLGKDQSSIPGAIPPIVIAFNGLRRGILNNRLPSVITMCLP